MLSSGRPRKFLKRSLKGPEISQMKPKRNVLFNFLSEKVVKIQDAAN